MSSSARYELARSRASSYVKGSKKVKTGILDEFVAATGVNRKTAIGLLRNPPGTRPKARGKPTKRYGTDVCAALEVLWATCGYISSTRLVPFIPSLLDMLKDAGEWSVSESVRQKLLKISPATCDRLLRPHKRTQRTGRCMTKPGSMLKAQIPIRTYDDWTETEPGFCEMDLVHHCDDDTNGEYVHSLTLTDVVTGWTENKGLRNRSQTVVLTAVMSIQDRFPFPIKGLDSDSGGEFINAIMLRYCQERKILFTRSRPYKKNDACRVEQKNWSVVRQNVGYDRLEGQEACRALNAFYNVLRIRVNFLQPSQRLIGKQRVGARIRKKYDVAKTPCQRVLDHPCVPEDIKQALRMQLKAIKPMEIAKEILRLREALRGHAR